MAKRWLVGLVAAIAVVCMAGVGFSAFTASAVVYGNASAASVGLDIQATEAVGCFYYGHDVAAPGNVSFSNENEQQTAITLNVANMTPDDVCQAYLEIQNVGTQPLNVSITLYTAGSGGICGSAFQTDCYDVFTLSGIESSGWFYYTGSPTAPGPADVSVNFTDLAPGASYFDAIGIDIPPGSDDGTPSAASFALVYSATVGFDTA